MLLCEENVVGPDNEVVACCSLFPRFLLHAQLPLVEHTERMLQFVGEPVERTTFFICIGILRTIPEGEREKLAPVLRVGHQYVETASRQTKKRGGDITFVDPYEFVRHLLADVDRDNTQEGHRRVAAKQPGNIRVGLDGVRPKDRLPGFGGILQLHIGTEANAVV